MTLTTSSIFGLLCVTVKCTVVVPVLGPKWEAKHIEKECKTRYDTCVMIDPERGKERRYLQIEGSW